jgi:sec-independent protein translocase protein TatA
MFGMGPMEMLMALVVVLLLFGAKRIPEIAGSFGKGIREFKRNMSDVQKEIQQPAQPTDAALPREQREEVVQQAEPKRLL